MIKKHESLHIYLSAIDFGKEETADWNKNSCDERGMFSVPQAVPTGRLLPWLSFLVHQDKSRPQGDSLHKVQPRGAPKESKWIPRISRELARGA